MAISPTDVVLPAGVHSLETRQRSNKNLRYQAERGGHKFSLHHILPYRYPLFVGVLMEGFRDAFYPSAPRWPEGGVAPLLGDTITGRAAAFLAQSCHFDGYESERRLCHRFAWMAPNLFEGPKETWRIDDPGLTRTRESLRPHSMPPAY